MTFSLFVWARIIGGLSKGNVSLSMAIVSDVYVPEKRGRGMVSTQFLVFINLYILIVLNTFLIIMYCCLKLVKCVFNSH